MDHGDHVREIAHPIEIGIPSPWTNGIYTSVEEIRPECDRIGEIEETVVVDVAAKESGSDDELSLEIGEDLVPIDENDARCRRIGEWTTEERGLIPFGTGREIRDLPERSFGSGEWSEREAAEGEDELHGRALRGHRHVRELGEIAVVDGQHLFAEGDRHRLDHRWIAAEVELEAEEVGNSVVNDGDRNHRFPDGRNDAGRHRRHDRRTSEERRSRTEKNDPSERGHAGRQRTGRRRPRSHHTAYVCAREHRTPPSTRFVDVPDLQPHLLSSSAG